MSTDQLTEYQRLLVDQFISITSGSATSQQQAIHFLESNDWNLEISIIHYYQSSPESQRDFISNYTESLTMSSNTDRSLLTRISSAFNNTSAPLLPGAYPTTSEASPSKLHQFFTRIIYFVLVVIQFVLLLPLVIILKVLGYILVITLDRIAPVFSKLFGLRLSPGTYYARKNLTNPTERSRRFVYEFDELINNKPLLDVVSQLGPEDHIKESDSSLMEISRPNFLECSYTNALYLLKKEFRWLMIYIQSDEHEDRMPFIQQVLLNDQFLAFLKNNEILVWGGNLKESECFQISNNFKISGFPFLGLIGLTTEDSSSAPQVSLVSKVQGISFNILRSDGSINTPKIIKNFHKTFERLNPNLVALRTESQQRDTSRNIRAQQDLAYELSLAQDRRREEERQRQVELQREQERIAQDAELQELQKRQFLIDNYKKMMQRESELDMSDRKETSRIAFRLTNGQRVQHVFHKSFTLDDIYLYADCLMNDITSELDNVNNSDSSNSSYQHKYNFNLISMMPRAELPADRNQLIGDNSIVYPSGNLIIEESE